MSAVPSLPNALAAPDADAQETREWLDALGALIETEGRAPRFGSGELTVDQAATR